MCVRERERERELVVPIDELLGVPGLGCRVWDLRFRVWSLKFRVEG